MSLKKAKKKFKNIYFHIPISLKVTIWYSFFIFLLFFVLISGSFVTSDILFKDINKKELIESVLEIANKPEKFDFYDDGIFFLQYSKNGQLLSGSVPKNFDVNASLSSEIKVYKTNSEEFFYYDSPLKKDDVIWIRGIMPISKVYKTLKLILFSLILISPFIFIFIIYGGYKIIKNSFKPVQKIADTALEIRNKQDFSKRIQLGLSKDEIYKMSLSFNEILNTLENSYIREKQFSSDVAHELKTPITVILAESNYSINYAENINDFQESLKVIERQAKKMSFLIQQLMDLAKLEQTQEIEFEKINLSNLIKNILDDYKFILNNKDILLKIEIKDNLNILANKILIEQLFNNLLNNALKFTKTEININLYQKQNDIILEIKDNGIGLSEKDKSLIWNRFYQVNSSRNKKLNEGYGLGLALVSRIVDLHKIRIEIESELGLGSNFKVFFKNLD